MNETSIGFKKAARLIFGWILVFLAVLLGVVGAVLSFFLCAVSFSNITLLSLTAVLVCFLIAFSLSRFAGGKILRAHRTRLAIGVGLITVIGVVLVSSFTIFRPLVPSSEIIKPKVPEGVEYWDLETGSRIAYLKFPAENKPKEVPIINDFAV